MYRSIIKPILFSLTIERAHRVVLILLRAIGLIPGGRWLLRKCYAVEHPALEREVFGIKFANPVGLAAGFDRNGEAFRELAALGFGFVEVGTVTPRPQAGNPRPASSGSRRTRRSSTASGFRTAVSKRPSSTCAGPTKDSSSAATSAATPLPSPKTPRPTTSNSSATSTSTRITSL